MNQEKSHVTVKLMERHFSVKCPPDKVAALHKAAKYLDSKIKEIKNSDKIINMDSLVVVTALNVVNDLLLQKKQNSSYMDIMSDQITQLQTKIEQALAEDRIIAV